MTGEPNHTGQLLDQALGEGIEAVKSGQPAMALMKLEPLVRLHPLDFQINYWLANAYRLNGQFGRAESIFKALISRHPGSEQAAFGLAFLLRDQGKLAQAGELLHSLGKQADIASDALLRIVGFLREINRFDESIDLMNTMTQRAPGDAASRFRLARLLQARGRFEEALVELRQALSIDAELGGAWLSLAQLQKFKNRSDPDYQLLHAGESRVQTIEARMCHGFALAKAEDDLQDFSAAWTALRAANAIAAKTLPWNRANWESLLSRKLSSGATPNTQRTDFSGQNALFIVGMLRSGTTLLEQKLAEDHRFCARGELNFLSHFDQQAVPAEEAGRELWAHLQQGQSDYEVFIDKNPLNFRYLDTLNALLPFARVVHVRRDGRNSCLSCFMQLFQHADSAFANQLEDITRVYSDYRRLMNHWKQIFPEKILEIRYEDLVNDTEQTLERVRSHAGVSPNNKPLPASVDSGFIRTASAWQARQGIHRDSLNRWQNYQEFAPAFFNRLAQIDEEYD